MVAALRVTLGTERRCGSPLIEDQSHRMKLSQFEVELHALEFLELRLLYTKEDDPSAQILASMLKQRGTVLWQRISETLWEAFGDRGMEFAVPTRPGTTGDENVDAGTDH